MAGGQEPIPSAEKLQLLAAAIEHVADIIEITDANGRYRYVNRAFEVATGYCRDEAIGRTPRDLLRADVGGDDFFAEIEKSLTTGSKWSGRLESRRKDGSPLVCEAVISPIQGDDGKPLYYIGIRRDITAREQLQTKFAQSERLAAVGQLAAGVAHEINNPLSYILANVNYLAEEMDVASGDSGVFLDGQPNGKNREEIRSILADIEHGAMRIRDVVRDLSSFSRVGEHRMHAVDVRTVLNITLRLLSNEIKHRAALRRDFRDVPRVYADEARLAQVFLNLLLNAAQAIPVGAAASNEICVSTFPRGDRVVVQIRDSGEGIPAALLPRIMDPFFTTRPAGQGTGLGLSVCHNIVAALSGTMRITSELGEGTMVELMLPGCDIAKDAKKAAAAEPRIDARTPRILVIDDEPGVLRALKRILHAYDLTICSDGHQALELLRRTDYSLVFCDLMMPEVTGMDLYGEAVARRPELADRFVFITGGPFTTKAQQFLDQSEHTVVEKPFDPAELRALVARLLEAL